MNIFHTSDDPIECAQFLDTKRCNKMILESAQMLCTALYIHNKDKFWLAEYSVYPRKVHKRTGKIITKTAYYFQRTRLHAPTHPNHPSNIWVRETRANYEWLYAHFKALAEEYHKRRKHWHKSFLELDVVLSKASQYIPQGELTPFANCAANDKFNVNFKDVDDTTLAYRMYLNYRWDLDAIEPVWT